MLEIAEENQTSRNERLFISAGISALWIMDYFFRLNNVHPTELLVTSHGIDRRHPQLQHSRLCRRLRFSRLTEKKEGEGSHRPSSLSSALSQHQPHQSTLQPYLVPPCRKFKFHFLIVNYQALARSEQCYSTLVWVVYEESTSY